MLLELESSLHFETELQPPCIASTKLDDIHECVIANWETTTVIDNEMLQYVPIETIGIAECNSTKYFAESVPEGVICAKNNVSACHVCQISFIQFHKFN